MLPRFWSLYSWFLILGVLLFPLYGDTFLLNVSYDPTRELFAKINHLYTEKRAEEGVKLRILQSHGGSSRQAGYVLAGLRADVVSLAMESDISKIASQGFLHKDWKKRLPNDSTPFYSTIVFLTRKGNPRGIRDWEDLIQPNLRVITPAPKTSGGGKWNFLAALGIFRKRYSQEAEQKMIQLYRNVPIMDTGARGSASTFIQRKIGDVLIIWENEALLALKEAKQEQLEIIYPPTSIYARPMVAMVDRTVTLKNTKQESEKYLQFLYSEKAQEVIAESGYRPIHKKVAEKYASKYKSIELFTIEERFGSWEKINQEIFSDGKLVDKVLE